MLLEEQKDSEDLLGGRALIAAVLRQAVQDLSIKPRSDRATPSKKEEIDNIRQSARNFLRSIDARELAAGLRISTGVFQILLKRHGLDD